MIDKVKQTKLDITECEVNLKNKLSTILYLENVEKEKENSTEKDSCQFCVEDVTKVCENTNLYTFRIVMFHSLFHSGQYYHVVIVCVANA